MELRGGAELVDGLIEETEGVAERVWKVVWRIDERGRARAQDAQVDGGRIDQLCQVQCAG